tara:strand:+ start:1129 stop:2127 length:999 start_codon:yes stop_codon:yes gene_type:complete
MHKNKLTSLDKCIVLLSYINDRNPSLFTTIIEQIPNHHSQEILGRLKECPLYEKDQVQTVLEEYHDLTVEKTMLFPNESFKEHLQQKQSEKNKDNRVLSQQKRSFLDSASIDALIELIPNEPDYFVGLLCHMMGKEEFAEILSKIPNDLAKKGLMYYTKINIDNPSFLNELSQFYFEKIQKLKLRPKKTNIKQSKDIAEILELLPNSNKNTLKSIIPADISWNIIEDNLLDIEDIQYYPAKFQQVILSSIKSSETLARILSIIPSYIRIQLMKDCLTSRQFNIISEEIDQLKSNPLSEKDTIDISNNFIKQLRKLQSDQIIPDIQTFKKVDS